ncbi:HEAT repeat domain-containing protein [Candidatus Thorarchaeota archaeon]|nr:MAG: HEAT repeat domain-containing protein [Candidatus Thorarchaeota archaeon]
MPSRQWDYFMDNFFGDPYMMWHDGINPKSVCGLEGAERDQAENMLIESMKEGSYWAPMGLRELRSQKAVSIMKDVLAYANGNLLIEIAIALNVIEETTNYNQYILYVLREYPSPYTRLRAAMKLRDFPTPEVIEALFDAVSDVDYLVRNHASESLLAIHGLKPMISEYKEIFKLIIVDADRRTSTSKKEAAAAYKKAEEMLRALFEN